MNSPRAAAAPRLQPPANQWFVVSASSRTCGNASAMASAEPSGEALSTTITSNGPVVSAKTEPRHSSVIARVL